MEADRARVVERFVRLPQSMAQPGSGLGLSLAAAVARLHGGELTLEDNAPGLKVVITCRPPAGLSRLLNACRASERYEAPARARITLLTPGFPRP